MTPNSELADPRNQVGLSTCNQPIRKEVLGRHFRDAEVSRCIEVHESFDLA